MSTTALQLPRWHSLVPRVVERTQPSPSKNIPIIAAISFILGFGGLIAAGVGIGINSLIMLSVGGVSGFILFMSGLLLSLSYRKHLSEYEAQQTQMTQTQQEAFCRLNTIGPRAPQLQGDHYFDATQWRAHYGVEIESFPIPETLQSYLNSPCPFAPTKLVKETHMLVFVPSHVNQRPLDLTAFLALDRVLNPSILTSSQFDSFVGQGSGRLNRACSVAPLEMNGEPIARPYWLLMTRNPLPLSESLTFHEQDELLIPGYERPHAFEALICMHSEYLRSGAYIFPEARDFPPRPMMVTRCVESLRAGAHLTVGGNGINGTVVSSCLDGIPDHVGMAAVRRFYQN